ncbi:uncharacterized protein LOC127243194 [Andrographis paniculata]|uniref:uncharacterized protein LOC127243194 n=1 Tax=Andrographis paniculata TaxID=175694 RepID=UPI0021E8B154|nr:uncharacterized protein LOC127243194 [Andrographis paniculata]
MTAAKNSDAAASGEPLLAEPYPQSPQYVLVLPPYLPRYRRRRGIHFESCFRRVTGFSIVFLLLGAAGYVLWPSDPELSIVRVSLDRFNFRISPRISLDVALDVTIRVWNKDFYSIEYDTLVVAIGYRGEKLGQMTSNGGRIRARGNSYVNGTVRLDGIEVFGDAIFLLEDLSKGAIPFDTVSEINGKLGLFFFNVPLKAKISCEIIVSTSNQTITHQNCYPKA